MARRSPAIQNPIWSQTKQDNVRVIEGIIREMEAGNFLQASLLVNQVLTDDRIYSVVQTRVLGLLGKELCFEPAKDFGIGVTIKDDIEAEWPTMFECSALSQVMTWGLMMNHGLAQIIEDGPVWKLEWWHPQSLRWLPYQRQYRITAIDEGEFGLNRDGSGYRDDRGRRWMLYTPFGYGNTFEGLIRQLALLYLDRQDTRRDRARYSETVGQTIRLGTAPASAEQKLLDEYAQKLSLEQGEPVVVVRKGLPGNEWGLQLIEAVGKSNELFSGALDELDSAAATTVLGQSQSVDGQAGLGSNDQAGELVRHDIMAYDEDTFTDAIRAQFLVPYCDFTYGKGDMAPWPEYDIDPPKDLALEAKTHWDQAQADQIYVNIGALQPTEVAISRFGSEEGDYSLDTKIDVEQRNKMLELEKTQAMQDLINPPPPPVAPPANGVAPKPVNGTQTAQPPPPTPQ